MLFVKKFHTPMMILSITIMACLLFPLSGFAESVKEPYKIGGIFAVTGPASFLGDPEKKIHGNGG